MSKQYDNYLKTHIANVRKGLDYFIKNMPDLIYKDEEEDKKALTRIMYIDQFANHDESKYTPEEYSTYNEYFYGNNKSYKVVNEFNYAWLHHIHNNQHHWQHWVLIQDDEETICLEMPYKYIIEMICDWWSFSWQKDNLYEIFDWYDKHRKTIKLGTKTRKVVEDILDKIKNSLD